MSVGTSQALEFGAGQLRISFPQFGTELNARLADGALKGSYGSTKDGVHAFTAFAYCTCTYEGDAGPDITGNWDIAESGWRLTLQREGEDTLATVTTSAGKVGPLKAASTD